MLVFAVMRHESSFKINAESEAGAKGLMQVMPFHFKGFTVPQMFDPHNNVSYGIGILADALHDAKGNVTIALSLYNSGQKDGHLRFGQTIAYVADIVPYYNKLKGA